jgi:preprotein translocase SecE subunit
MKSFIIGLGSEFEKVTWPSAAEAFGLASLVIAVAIFTGYYLGFFDAIFNSILRIIIS